MYPASFLRTGSNDLARSVVSGVEGALLIDSIVLPVPARVGSFLLAINGTELAGTGGSNATASADVCGATEPSVSVPPGMARTHWCSASVEACFSASNNTFNESSLQLNLGEASSAQ